MAHELKITEMPVMDVNNKDIVIQVKKDGKVFGHLLISKGAIEWRGANREYRRRMRWGRFDELMMTSGRRIKS